MERQLIAIIPNSQELDSEAECALSAGIPVHRIDVIQKHDINIRDIYPLITVPSVAIYRGYMLSDTSYSMFYNQLFLKFNTTLIVSQEKYNLTHYYPNVYNYISMLSPKSLWCPCSSPPLENEIINTITQVHQWDCKYILMKDYVKSAKYTSEQFTKIANTSIGHLSELSTDLVYARGTSFNKGVVYKEYVPLKDYQYRGSIVKNEWRYFFGLKGYLISVDSNSNQSNNCTKPNEYITSQITSIASKIDSPYMTIDVAETVHNEWIILETGDGGVSGPSTGMDLQSHWNTLFTIFSIPTKN